MKRFFLFLLLAVMAGYIFSSCSSVRRSKTGCPMTEGIIH